jgi:ABC-type Fe3+ transport system permease subunit
MDNLQEHSAENGENHLQMTAPARRSRPLRRVGCAMLLVIWLLALLLPCFLIVLATQQEIIIAQGELPGQEFRVRLIMDIDQRGIGLWTTRTVDGAAGDICLITTVGYILWEGEGEPAEYCVCYTRTVSESAWQPSGRECPAN